jgi:hypothetical protein
MPSPPESTKSSLQLRLTSHARERWPQIGRVDTRFRSNFAYIAITLDDTSMALMRLRYGGSANRWGFAIYLASEASPLTAERRGWSSGRVAVRLFEWLRQSRSTMYWTGM